jgi:hypothetical protein
VLSITTVQLLSAANRGASPITPVVIVVNSVGFNVTDARAATTTRLRARS